MKLMLIENYLLIFKWWVDASYNKNGNGRVCTQVMMRLVRGDVISLSFKRS